jgi:hypothetical protein
LQVIRDWVLKFNAHGPDGLVDRKAPGQPPRLNDAHRASLAAVLESGPIPTVHGVGAGGSSKAPARRFRSPLQPSLRPAPARRAAPARAPPTSSTPASRPRLCRFTISLPFPRLVVACGRFCKIAEGERRSWQAGDVQVA